MDEISTAQILQHLRADAKELLAMELELAKAEAKVDISAEIDLAKGVGVAAVCGIMGLNMLIVAGVLALAPELAWVVALVIGVVLLAIAGIAAYAGWHRAEKSPLHITRNTLKEDIEWARKEIS